MIDKELLKYVTCFEKRVNNSGNEIYVFIVNFPEQWNAYPSDDNRILVKPADDGSYFYMGEVNSVDYDDIVNLIKDTIEINLDAERKYSMYQEKVDELREIFGSKRTYQELSTVTICIDGKPYVKSAPAKTVVNAASKSNDVVPFQEPTTETSDDIQKANFKDTLKKISKKAQRTTTSKRTAETAAPTAKTTTVRKTTKKPDGEYMSLNEVEELEKRFG